MNERRSESRKDVNVEVRYEGKDGRIVRGRARNLSMSGAYVETDNPLGTGSLINLTLDAADMGCVIKVTGKVRHVKAGKGMGIEFTGRNDVRLLLEAIGRSSRSALRSLCRLANEKI